MTHFELPRAKYQALGVFPFQDFAESKQEEINAACELPRPPAKWSRFVGCMMPSRAWFEWHVRRGVDPRKQREKTSPQLRARIVARDNWICGLCGLDIESPADLHVDHIKPLSRGGRHTEGNLQAAHARCNLAKGAKEIA